MTDPWGISGPRFLETYLGLLIAPAVAGLLSWQWRIRRVKPAGPRSGMTLHHLAYLAGGAKRAAESAAVDRRAAVADAGDER